MNLDVVPVHTVDTARLRKTLEHITAHPEEWWQGMWAHKGSCGTSYCLAGHVVHDEGYEFVWGPPTDDSGRGDLTNAWEVRDGAKILGVDSVARKLLGLSYVQSDELFSSINTLPDLWALANEFTHGEIEIPEEFK